MKKILLPAVIKYWHFIILFGVLSLVIWPIFVPGYFSHHDDLQVMRIYEMRKCILDFQIPCRWVPDMGYGNGFPLFNYYNPFPYYIGAIFSFLIGYINSAKMLFLIPVILGFVSMYLLVKELWGKLAGVSASILYTFAPYKALDLYVRGAVAESFALSLVPLVFYFGLKILKRNTFKNFLGFSLTISFFMTSHNILILLFLPLLLFWLLFWFTKYKSNIVITLAALVIGIGLAAFFIFPAFVEKDLVQADTLRIKDLDFRAHFVSLEQIFIDRNWGYGPSVPGPKDEMSFQIGWPHWWLVPISAILALYIFLIKKHARNFLIVSFFSLVFLISLFMMHNKSAFIWEMSDTLQYAQFPWRFLGVSIFITGILGGFIIYALKPQLKVVTVCLIVLLTILFNTQYFIPQKFYDLTDGQKLSGQLWEEQQRAAILDYLPKTAYEPREKAPDKPIVVSGTAEVADFKNYTNNFNFTARVTKKVNIELPIFDFPNWTVWVNNKKFAHSRENFLGRIGLDLPEGDYKIEGFLKNTPIRVVSNTITLLCILILFLLGLYGKNRFFNK